VSWGGGKRSHQVGSYHSGVKKVPRLCGYHAVYKDKWKKTDQVVSNRCRGRHLGIGGRPGKVRGGLGGLVRSSEGVGGSGYVWAWGSAVWSGGDQFGGGGRSRVLADFPGLDGRDFGGEGRVVAHSPGTCREKGGPCETTKARAKQEKSRQRKGVEIKEDGTLYNGGEHKWQEGGQAY